MLVLTPNAGLEAPSGASSPALWPATPTPTCSMELEARLRFGLPVLWGRREQTPRLAPTLLERRGLSRDFGKDPFPGDEAHLPVRVKNTFIDGFADEDDDGVTPPMTAHKSWHVGCAHEQASDDPKPLPRQSSQESACEPPASCEHSMSTTLSRSTSEDSAATLAFSGVAAGGSQTASTLPEVPAPPQPEWPRRPEESGGSALHGTGQCRPCGWFWKPEGCSHGDDCRHCHMCPEGELNARKKAKLAKLQQLRSCGSSRSSR